MYHIICPHACAGDSGGGIFAEADGEYWMLSVVNDVFIDNVATGEGAS